MDELLDMLAFLKVAPFFVYIFVRYVLSLSLVLSSAMRLTFISCGSRKLMAGALALSVPLVFWNFFVGLTATDPRHAIVYVLSALTLVSWYFWWRSLRGVDSHARHAGYDVLIVSGVCVYWLIVIVLGVLKNGFIAH